MSKPTSAEEYRDQLMMLVQGGKLLLLCDVPELLNMIERADSLGAMLDPTLYREKVSAMHEDKELLEAALPFWRLMTSLEARAREKMEAARKAAGLG